MPGGLGATCSAACVRHRPRAHYQPSGLPQAARPHKCRRWVLGGLIYLASLAGSAGSSKAEFVCGGLRGYKLRECLREKRKQKEGELGESVRDEYLKTRQFEQPGELVTLPSGIQYREMLEGSGNEAILGSACSISYIVYRLASGAYFKYSSGGTPVYLFSVGYSYEGKDDVGNIYKFRLGDNMSLPAAATPAVVGMREGGRRRILIPPNLGWVNDKIGPRPDTFGGTRRLVGHRDEPLLLEIELVRARTPDSSRTELGSDDVPKLGNPYKLPAPPSASSVRK